MKASSELCGFIYLCATVNYAQTSSRIRIYTTATLHESGRNLTLVCVWIGFNLITNH